MSATKPDAPPPYAFALGASLLVLLGLLASLAPTVTFWDAGEFIAAARILGIPHPPGTPLFVLIGHVWGRLLPFGEYAFRLNLLSALFSSAAAGCLFLVAHQALGPLGAGLPEGSGRLLRVGGGLAAALLAAFTFTQWQNSNETEVYAVATFTIAAVCWLCLRWRFHRASGSERAPWILLLILYLAGLSIGNHLLALLAGPAVVVFLAATLQRESAADPVVRRAEWAQVAAVAAVWALLIGCGLGSGWLAGLAGLAAAVAVLFSFRARTLSFALAALVLATVGVTAYLYLYIRAGQHPMVNEAAPDNLEALLAVMRRAQYGIRTPLDDPTVPHGPDNPGRTLALLGLQTVNYFQYFDWQWANGIKGGLTLPFGTLPWRTLFTLVFASLGLHGLLVQRRIDRLGWRLVFTLWLVTGLGLLLYMNFKPGFSLGYERYPDFSDHEVRERDYFYVVSFVVWAFWAGLALAELAGRLLSRPRSPTRLFPAAVLALGVVPLVTNFSAATRRQGPDARLAADFAYDLLNSVPPYGILFTYGDNDTFPLWWAQEAEGIRRDVTVICLALAQTEWNMRQLRDNPVRPFDEAAAPEIWRGRRPVRPDWPTHTMSDAEIDAAVPTRLPSAVTVQIGPVTHTYPVGTVFYPADVLTIRVLQQNLGRRPIAWAGTVGSNFGGLGDYVMQQGLVAALQPAPPDTTQAGIAGRGLFGPPVDLVTTERLAWETYRYAGLLEGGTSSLESTAASIAR
ncbi:MAG: glycosyltransferase family 117 protein, partial [Gemmatimonadales bacterium]